MPDLEPESNFSTCEQVESDCRCYHCGDCGDSVDPENTSQCLVCEYCFDCCSNNGNCYDCSGCGRRRSEDSYSRCSNCEQCSNCCECWHCESHGEYHGRDVGQCSACESCYDRCNCSTCGGCDTTVRTLECGECDRCDDCGCECDSSEDEEEEEDEVPEDPNAPRCSTCNQVTNRCWCLQCHTIDPDTGTISESHIYNPRSGGVADVPCTQCGRCNGHCSATTCVGCALKRHTICERCNKCKYCCACPKCSNGHAVESLTLICVSCLRCAEHCRCPRCPKCSAKGSRCSFCKQCVSCCKSGDSECGAHGRSYPIPHINRDFRKHTPSRANLKRLNNPRLIGMEPEISGITKLGSSKDLFASLEKWGDSVVPDGSIGDQPTSFEINTQPSGGDLFLDHTKELFDGLKKMGAAPSQKCGCHVHIDCSDYTMYDLRRLIDLYTRVERALFDLCHPYRLNYRYAKVTGSFLKSTGLIVNPKQFREALNKKLYSDNMDGLRSVEGAYYSSESKESKHRIIKRQAKGLEDAKKYKGNPHRYNAFNVHSFFMRKTIEFRHHEGTADYETIVGWSLVLQELVSSALRMTNAQVAALPRNSKKALIAVLPERLHPYLYEKWSENTRIRNGNSDYVANYRKFWGSNLSEQGE